MYLSNFISRIYSLIFDHDGYVDTSLCRHMTCTISRICMLTAANLKIWLLLYVFVMSTTKSQKYAIWSFVLSYCISSINMTS